MLKGTEATMPSFSVANTGGLVNNIFGFMVQFVIVGGALWTVWGVVVLAGALKDKNGPGLQGGVWQIVGGIMILVSAILFGQLIKFQ